MYICVKSLLNAVEGKRYLIPVGRRLGVGRGLDNLQELQCMSHENCPLATKEWHINKSILQQAYKGRAPGSETSIWVS